MILVKQKKSLNALFILVQKISGDDLLSRPIKASTIGANELNF